MEDIMNDPINDFDPDAIRNPSTGIFARNPTRIEISKKAADQDEIVKAIKGTSRQRQILTYTYEGEFAKEPRGFPGMLQIRDLAPESIIAMCKNLMRSKPNIFRIHVKLGDYEEQQRIDNPKTRELNSNKPRAFSEIGEALGEVLADRNINATEVLYMVRDVTPGNFYATGEVYGVAEEDYTDDKKFNPSIEIEFISNA
jgi:hypothetical protein